jgi:hypothetical protein
MLINAKEARAATNKINSEYIESILEESIKEAIAKGHFYCYITFGDTYAAIEATAILKKRGYKYRRSAGDQLCYKIEW